MTSSLILSRAAGASRRIRPPIRPINSDAFSRAVAAVLVGVLGCGAGGALAQDKRAIVQERRAAMKAQGAAMGGVKRYVDGEADQKAAAQSAGALVGLARGEPERFPPSGAMDCFVAALLAMTERRPRRSVGKN